ncbi:MAG: prolipoprotein diacylglyceryl transferase family protein, partial [Planctomycetota bacterium]
MRQTLFYIPNEEIAGLPVFGRGWLLLAWAIFSIGLLIWLICKPGQSAEAWGYVPLLALVGAAIWFLVPRLCEPEGLPIRGYGVMLLVAVASTVALAVWRARRLGIDPELVLTLSFWIFVPGILGARAYYVVAHWAEFQKETPGETFSAILNVTQGGLVVYGSVIGGVLGLMAFVYKYKMPPLATFDLVTPSVLLGMAIGRIGCLLNGCCFGGVCELPWRVTFPVGSPAHVHQVEFGETFLYGLKIPSLPEKDFGGPGAPAVIAEVEPGSAAEQGGLRPGAQIAAIDGRPVHTLDEAEWVLINARKVDKNVGKAARPVSVEIAGGPSPTTLPVGPPPRSEPVHPTQVYSTVNAFLLCLFLLAYAPYSRRDGELWAMFLTLYPLTRFLLEMIRTDEPAVFLGLKMPQIISLVLMF